MIRKIKQHFQLRKARQRLILLGQMIDAIDKGFTKNNVPRKVRRQFWYNFIHYPEHRKDFIGKMKI